MKRIPRNTYLQELLDRRNNGLIKVITGIRRSGKSFLLDPIFKESLKKSGVPEDHIVKIEFDRPKNQDLLDPKKLEEYIESKIRDKKTYYLLLDEIQLVPHFEFALNGLLYEKNLDIYVTGSNSKFLSTDIITEFRGRGDQIHIYPLSFSEFFSVFNGSEEEAWNEYLVYGGMPQVILQDTPERKSAYLKNLFDETYFRDIIERNNIKRSDILDSLTNILASSVGSLTNPQKLYDTFISNGEKELSPATIAQYLNYLEDSFLVSKAMRYDVKGKRYISTPQKYYFTDVGLRNARLNFRQQEIGHLMENIIYNELLVRGYNVDVGVVESREGDSRQQLEVDFVCNQGDRRCYIQSSLNLDTRETTLREERSLLKVDDNFKKVILIGGNTKPWFTEEGIQVMGVEYFLLNRNSLNLY